MTNEAAPPADHSQMPPSSEIPPAPPLGVSSVITASASSEAHTAETAPVEEALAARPSGPPAAATPAEAAVRGQAEAPPARDGQESLQPARLAPASVLVIDIGGTNVKILATGQTEPRKAPSGREFTPAKLVETVRGLAHDWEYEAVTIGCPAMIGPHGPRSEPGNLGPGWVGFDFATAFDKPVKLINDAALQALGSYEGGRMLFLGLGTGLGSALIAGHVIIPLELGRLLYDTERTLGEVLGRAGLEKLGKGEWRRAVGRAVTALMGGFVADYVVVGGGNAKRVKELPPGVRRGHNLTAFRGGFRLWSVEDAWVMAAPGGESRHPTAQEALRLL
jgi:polyphosphate glucokinase